MSDVIISQGIGSRAAANDYIENQNVFQLKEIRFHHEPFFWFILIDIVFILFGLFFPSYKDVYFILSSIFIILTIVIGIFKIIEEKVKKQHHQSCL